SPLGRQPLPISLRQLDRETYQVLMAPPHGMTNPVTLDVPVGLPRIINVATLKAMLGANSRDVAFRKAVDEERWAICSDNYPVDHDAVEATKQMPALRRLFDQALPDAVVHCLRLHQKSAGAVGARYIFEVAYEPECYGLRQRVVGLAAAAMGMLERYPYLVEDEDLMACLIVLRTDVVPVCSNCPYLQYRL